ncbi:hypothetical protein F5Y01DRAFT_269373 [Xylaria sp. FL0043]|nr:hypothetical protein F5Y01DRAFT_269373 [Xylaria sp. FL0043]
MFWTTNSTSIAQLVQVAWSYTIFFSLGADNLAVCLLYLNSTEPTINQYMYRQLISRSAWFNVIVFRRKIARSS